jgi:hypothetical protein
MARCPDCKTRIAPWRTLALETKSKPLVCRQCGAVLRMTPGWLVAIGALANGIAQFALPRTFHQSRGLGTAIFIVFVLVGPLLIYAYVAPAEKADRPAGDSGAG